MKRLFLSLVFFAFSLYCGFLYPQNMTTYVYNNENGLISNFAKSISQDKDGFIWVASDAGLSRFDGNNFVNFQTSLPSLYVKQVKLGQDNKLKILSDFGLGNFVHHNGAYSYEKIINSNSKESTDTPYYPKQIFEDSRGVTWIGDLAGVSILKKDNFKKFRFADKYRPDSYFRAFSFVELDNYKIFTASFNGFLFSYDEQNSRFIPVPFNNSSKGFSISALVKLSGHSFLLGTSEGLFLASLQAGHLSFEKLNNIQQISSIAINKDNDLFIGTWTNGLYFGNLKSISRFLPLTFSSIQDLFLDNQNNIWAASDEGIAMIKKNRFENIAQSIPPGMHNMYLQQILSDDQKKIYYSDGNSIYKIENSEGKYFPAIVYSSWSDKIFSFALRPSGVWISYWKHPLEFRDLKTKKVLFSYDFKDDRLSSLFSDNKGFLWGWLAKRRQIVRFDSNFKPVFIDFKFDGTDYINLFKQSEDGTIYCAGFGIDSFVFRFDPKINKFVNLANSFSNMERAQIQVFDLQFIKNDKMLLATSSGVLLYNNSTFSSYKIPSFFGTRITKAILFNSGKMWLGTDKGILYLTEKDSLFFDKQDGLSNSSIIPQGFKVDADGQLWVATAKGVCILRSRLNNISQTSDPSFTNLKISGKEIPENYSNLHEFQSGTNLSGTFISLYYPSDRILFKYRLIGFDSTWSLPNHLNTINLYGLPIGNYVLQIQAKSPELFWSNVVDYPISIVPMWYFSSPMIALYATIVFSLIAYLVIFIIGRRIKILHEREVLLTKLVDQKTIDLRAAIEKTEKLLETSEKTNRLLEEATQQKSHMLSVASHDLKNPLQSIIGFSEILQDELENPEMKNMAGIIISSSRDMLKQINEILDAAAIESKNLKLNLKKVSVNEVVKEIIKNNNFRARQKKQILEISLMDNNYVIADDHWLKIALDNVVNNAIKYSPTEKHILVSTQRVNGNVLIRIKDEGQGLTNEDLEKMFRRYQRLSAKPTGGESSTGLGLSIVKDIIDLHNGKIWAVKNPADGAEFIIQLPADPDA